MTLLQHKEMKQMLIKRGWQHAFTIMANGEGNFGMCWMRNGIEYYTGGKTFEQIEQETK